MAEVHREDARCARCGTAFHCGAREPTCACAEVGLDDFTRTALQQRFVGCLCLACLRALQAEPDIGAA